MDLLPSEDQRDLVAAAGDFISSRRPIDEIRSHRGDAQLVDPGGWREGAELGLLTLGLDEEYGGSGQSIDDEVILFMELAKHLAVGPFLASTLGARVAAATGHQELAGRIGEGSAMIGLAELRGEGEIGADGFKGSFDLLDCAGCSHALLVTREGAALAELAEFGDITESESVDPGTRLSGATVSSGRVSAWLPAESDWIWGRAQILDSAYLAGLADAITELCTEHAKTREQFGRPIGVHQAVKHAIVDMAVRAESASSQTFFAAAAFKAGRPDTEFQILAAKTVAAEAAISNGGASIQVHGGMGYTYEHDAHLYLKRAIVYKQLFASASDVLADLLDLEAAQ
ncbi:acyl-CoA dehydrogenase family protein [Gordonia hydrophobica]|uniref:Acyl-CoA dehydrogenase family protein n=1 Tax=Gordonia hydrophobica TaxID=40516 RepID=A0ABZ2U1T2_9ACTN|nr:acyl-CoA dehydrogenase family protein [Gordonia hydrophobica]MBM7369193.1 alkylation response protein AidB-like acyl-CoA dehydrogenase [Gordonia hydrophobica]